MDDGRRLTVKYILSDDNCDGEQLAAFVELISRHRLENAYFQVSCDFRIERINTKIMLAIYELSARLFRAGLLKGLPRRHDPGSPDDRPQWPGPDLRSSRSAGSTTPEVVGGGEGPRYDLWGGGLQADWIVANTTAGREGRIGSVLRAKDAPRIRDGVAPASIVPAAVQRLLDVEREIEACGLAPRIAYRVFY